MKGRVTKGCRGLRPDHELSILYELFNTHLPTCEVSLLNTEEYSPRDLFSLVSLLMVYTVHEIHIIEIRSGGGVFRPF